MASTVVLIIITVVCVTLADLDSIVWWAVAVSLATAAATLGMKGVRSLWPERASLTALLVGERTDDGTYSEIAQSHLAGY